ncbi:radical SAM protein [Helicobacter mustelae]|uniref:radical SAM protein n=1 Tax=Helicobacter mustelae TaxID=217 RepID=UPI000DF961D0|nr:radical SAM protein [Helicobacter mustelae]STP12610.1 radical SAM protein [Helicobacter mustelae]
MILFGPIFSRRFGTSLGIDLSPYAKQCNFDCLYCELEGKKAMREMREIIPVEEILKELCHTPLQNIDVLTITANGEPTLYPHLFELITEIKKQIPPHIQTLILSNGSRFGEPSVQKALLLFDKVKFSFDGGNEKIFSRIDRPHKSLKLEEIAGGILEFSKIYKGELIAEILFVKNINDGRENLNSLVEFFGQIKLLRIDVGTIDRPPAYKSTPLSLLELEEIARFLQHHLPDTPISIPKRASAPLDPTAIPAEVAAPAAPKICAEQLYDLIKLRPLELSEADAMLDPKAKAELKSLLKDQKIFITEINSLCFYTIKQK